MPGKRILIAPLDWGLGHATRCIPIIKELQKKGNDVTIAGEGFGITLIKNEFPGIKTIHLKGYRVWYAKDARFFFLSMLIQVPKIIRSILKEQNWLKRQLKETAFDLVISDNRYGLHSKKTKTVFITHQLKPISGGGPQLDFFIQWCLYRYVNKFNICWIPDNEGMNNIGGTLSNPKKKPFTFRLIGLLSRLENHSQKNDGSILVILSGPEPQRTILEKILLDQLKDIEQKTVFVRGISALNSLTSTQYLEIHNYMDSKQLTEAMSAAAVVICRSGYSSIMDLIKMKKRALLIPTPGQTEQIHLSSQLQKKGLCILQYQEAICLKEGLLACNNLPEIQENMNFDGFEKAIQDLGI